MKIRERREEAMKIRRNGESTTTRRKGFERLIQVPFWPVPNTVAAGFGGF